MILVFILRKIRVPAFFVGLKERWTDYFFEIMYLKQRSHSGIGLHCIFVSNVKQKNLVAKGENT